MPTDTDSRLTFQCLDHDLVPGQIGRVMPFALLLALFFLSGACGLAYEVVWIRLLSLTLSITVYALTTVLCAFMAGLGLGAWIAGSFADRVRRPLVAFGVAELGISACGMIVPEVLYRLGPSYVWLREVIGESQVMFTAGRFVLAFLVLVVPTTLMGTTLPFLSRVAVSSLDVVGGRVGMLYGINTVGAVLGTVLAGFYLIPAFGLTMTSGVAAAVNVAIGLMAIAAGMRMQPQTASPTVAEPSELQDDRHPETVRRARVAALVFAISGFSAMGYELLWTRALEPFTHNSTYAYTAMLAMFLLGIGGGSLVGSRWADASRRPLATLGLLQLAVCLSVLGALQIYSRFEHGVPAIVEHLGGISSWSRVVVLIFAIAASTMLVTTFLFGVTFPFVAKAVVDTVTSTGRRIGRTYTANTVGSIAGAIVFGFAVLPALGVRNSFIAVLCCNLLAAGVAFASELKGNALLRSLIAVGTCLLAGLLLVPPDFFRRGFEERFGELLFYREEVTDTVMVTDGGQPGGRWIRYGDGRGTAGTRSVIEDRTYSHIAMLLNRNPRKILQITFGVGNSLAAVLRHPVEEVTCVELSPGVIAAAPFFADTNRDVLSDPRVDLVIEDGRNFLLASRDSYDVIRLDPPELHTRGVVNLYTREFYQLARDHLAPGGIFSIWVNAVMTPIEDLRMLVRTVQDVFPHVSVWQGPLHYSWVVNGSVEPHDPDLPRMLEAYRDPSIQEDLASIGLPTPYDFLDLFVMAGDEVRDFAGEGPLVVDDHTYLDFTVPRSRDASFGIGNVNTAYWLIQQIEPSAEYQVVAKLFLTKVKELEVFRRDVAPHVQGLDRLNLTQAELASRIEAAKKDGPIRP